MQFKCFAVIIDMAKTAKCRLRSNEALWGQRATKGIQISHGRQSQKDLVYKRNPQISRQQWQPSAAFYTRHKATFKRRAPTLTRYAATILWVGENNYILRATQRQEWPDWITKIPSVKEVLRERLYEQYKYEMTYSWPQDSLAIFRS